MQSTSLGKYTIWFNNSEEFHKIKSEIFSQGAYYVELENPEPIIIDAGAHIGLATLYFKKLYPKAKIWAIEPLPVNFQLLTKNIEENFLDDVECLNVALSDQSGEVILHEDASDEEWFSTASIQSGAWNRQQQTKPINVPGMKLSELLERIGQPIDFLKMDIEGSEFTVLKEAGQLLRQVRHMMIEFHPIQEQYLIEGVEMLKQFGFHSELWKDGHSVSAKRAKGLVYIEAKRSE
jgi:FkbM family methyltransferase